MTGPHGRPQAPQSCIVVGGGFIGTACALRLQLAGVQTALVDPGDVRQAASFGNIGHIAAEQCEPLASLDSLASFPARLFAFGGPLDFRLQDIGAWLPWALRFIASASPAQFERSAEVLTGLLGRAMGCWTDLLAQAGGEDVLRRSGHAVVWMTPAAAERGQARWMKARTGTASFRELHAAELAAYEAVLARAPAGGLMFSGTGQVTEPLLALRALSGAFVRAGGRTVAGKALAVETRGDRAVVTVDSAGELAAHAAVLAAGVRSARLLAPSGLRVPLIAERGYSIHTPDHAWPDDLPLTVFEERSTVLARFATGVRAASFVEFGRPDAPPDPRKWAMLEAHLRALGAKVSPPFDRWMGSRPTLPDYLPAIGRVPDGRIYYAFGHHHLGLTLAAVTAEMVEAAVLHGRALPDALDAARF